MTDHRRKIAELLDVLERKCREAAKRGANGVPPEGVTIPAEIDNIAFDFARTILERETVLLRTQRKG